MDEPMKVRPEVEPDELLFAIPDTVAELLGQPVAPVVEPVPAPVASPVLPPVPERLTDDERAAFTGSDYAYYALVAAVALAATGVVATLGYVIYTLVTSIFGAVASGVAVAAGGVPLLLLAGVVLLCARSRGAPRSGGVSLPGVGASSAGLLGGVGSAVASAAGPIPRLMGRAARGRRAPAQSVPGVSIPGATPLNRAPRRSRRVRDVVVSDPAVRRAPSSLAQAFGFHGEPDVGVSPGAQVTPESSWRARVAARRAEAALTAPHRASVRFAVWSRVTGRRAVDEVGIPLSVPHRGAVASLVFGSVASGAAAPAATVPRRSGLSARVLGAGSVTVNSHGERVQGRLSTLLHGPESPTAQLAALANGRRADGLMGRLRDLRGSREDKGIGRSSDIPIEHLVLLDSLTQRWIDRLRAATPRDIVYGSWMTQETDRCKFCAVGFLWDEFDSDRWYVAARSRMIGGIKRWYHRDASLMFRAYGPKFLWFISDKHDSGEWDTRQIASFVENTILKGEDVDAYST